MVYTREIGLRPRILAARLAMIAVGAAIAVAVSYSTPVALLLSEDAPYVIGLTGAAFGLVALLAPLVSNYLPNRVTPLPDGVAIPRRAITFMSAAVTTFLLIALGLALGNARSLVVGQGPSSGMAIAAATLTVIPSFWLAQRPWRRRIELRRDELVLVAGEATERIPWNDIASIGQPHIFSSWIVRYRFRYLRDYQKAAIQVLRSSDTRATTKGQLRDRYPTGDLACEFTQLLPALRHLAADPANRTVLADPDQTLQMINAQKYRRRTFTSG